MRIPLLAGAYQADSIIANAQRCVNLYPENNPQADQAPVPVTHYQTPGINLLAPGPIASAVRCSYRASNGDLYIVILGSVYYVSPLWDFTLLGTITVNTTPVSMSDNALVVVLVDGTPNGYSIVLATRSFAPIVDDAFFGADRVDYLDTFFIFNNPGTNQFYISPSEWVPGVAFDPLDIAAKTGGSDPLVSLIVMHREIWLIGSLTTEIWYDAGASDFAFQEMPGMFIEHGIVAKYSLCKQDLFIYWLSQDLQGQTVVLQGSGYVATRISTHAIENEIRQYSVISDAIGFTYQQNGHIFYILTFPTADKTWCYDVATQQWHERLWLDGDGAFHRHRANCVANAYGVNVVGDWQNGNLYAFDLNTYTDNGAPMAFIRSFPQIIGDGNRVLHTRFIADMDVGEQPAVLTSDAPQASLRWSDTKGASWGNPVMQSMGAGGQYLTSMQWRRLGMARDRVYELSWSINARTALNGAFLETSSAGT